MTLKFSSITLLAFVATIASAQTPTKPATKPATTAQNTSTTTHHSATATTPATPPNIPKVVGIPKPLYALRYIDTAIGTGPLAESSKLGSSQADSIIMWYTVKYTGWLTDGTKFDSSFDHPGAEPFTFPQGIRRVIAGWDTAFQGMHIGGKRRLFIPYQLAYGEFGRPPKIPAKSDLIFDIELVSISDKAPTPPTPPQPPAAAPKPEDAPAKPADPNAKPTEPAKPATAPQPQPQSQDPPKPDTTPHPQSL